jgi:hypothetical protein
MREQYRALWDWLLDKGLILQILIVNGFFLSIGIVSMIGLRFFLKHWSK